MRQDHCTAEILDPAGEGIYGLDLEGRVMFVNPAAARLTGHTVGELVGQSMHEMIHHTRPDGRGFSRDSCRIYAAFHDGKVHHADDEVFWRKDAARMEESTWTESNCRRPCSRRRSARA